MEPDQKSPAPLITLPALADPTEPPAGGVEETEEEAPDQSLENA